ncbi:HTH_Tnp_Tc3_2 domain-containing protein [Trichonephila clavipes]|nr:HTH_Tnp_Tc3_2 domain-containing protein [Trichonephila clavipes]
MNQGATTSVSESTVQRTLLPLGFRRRRLVHAPMLPAVHRQKRVMATTSRTMQSVIQLSVYVRSSKITKKNSLFLLASNLPRLNPIENLWDHLNRAVRAMDPHPLATTLVQDSGEHLQEPN